MGKRAVPAGKTRLISVPVSGMLIEDLIVSLEAARYRKGHPRVYVNSQGDLIVAVDNWTT